MNLPLKKEDAITAINQGKLHLVDLNKNDDKLRLDKDVVLAAVAKDGQALQHAIYRFRADPQVVSAAVISHPAATEHASLTGQQWSEMPAEINRPTHVVKMASLYNTVSTRTYANDKSKD